MCRGWVVPQPPEIATCQNQQCPAKKPQKATTRPGCQTPSHPGEERERHKSHLKPPQLTEIWRDTYHHTGPIFRLFTPRGRSPGSARGTPSPQLVVPQPGAGPRPVCLGPSHSNGPESQGFIFIFFLNKRRREITTISQPSPAEIPQLGRPRRCLGFIILTRL